MISSLLLLNLKIKREWRSHDTSFERLFQFLQELRSFDRVICRINFLPSYLQQLWNKNAIQEHVFDEHNVPTRWSFVALF
jgi:hypothetical protein